VNSLGRNNKTQNIVAEYPKVIQGRHTANPYFIKQIAEESC
jgi:hypothetical protein